MTGRLSRSIGLAALVAVSGGGVALGQTAPAAPPPAQDAPAAPPPGGPPGAAAAPPAGSAAPAPASTDTPAPAGSAAAAADAAASKDSAVTGYGYRKGPSHASAPLTGGGSRPPHYGRLVHHANEAVATFTGFEMLADGGSRLFVQLSKQVDVDQQKGPAQAVPAGAPGSRKGKRAHAAAMSATTLTFVLKGTEVVQRNNENALVTVHFNTPVLRARLLPAGHDLRLVVDLRADVTPAMKVVPAKDNGAMLQIDFPQGSYLPAGGDTADDGPQAGANDSMGSN